MLSQKSFAQSSPNGESTSTNDSPWVCATVPTSSKKICLNSSSVWTQCVLSINFCMLQKAIGHKILLSSKRCPPASRRLGSRSTPENYALAPTNLTIWVITSLVTGLCPYQRNSSPFKPSQFQKLANNCVSLSVR